MSQDREQGVLFPRGEDGRRSTAAVGRAVWADAVRGKDPALAEHVEAAGDWRKAYVPAVVAHTAAATRSDKGVVDVARAGLDALGQRMVFERDGQTGRVAEALTRPGAQLRSQTVRGEGERVRELVLPYRGQQLRGDALRRQLDAWAARGTVEPSCAAALHRVLDEPGWLDLSDRAFALLGAGAEMGPLAPLSQWGAHVVAVDVPSPRVWERLTAAARAGAGTLTAPEGTPGTLGVDLLTQTPEVAAFVQAAAPGLPMTIGSYAYADGARHVQVVHASDAVVELLLRDRPGSSYAELATPTDAFAVPDEVVQASRRRWAARGAWGVLQTPARSRGAVRAGVRHARGARGRQHRGHRRRPRPAAGSQLHAGQAGAALARGGRPGRRAHRLGERRAGDEDAVGHEEPAAGRGVLRRRAVRRRGLLPVHHPGAHGRPARARPACAGSGARAP